VLMACLLVTNWEEIRELDEEFDMMATIGV
jgi:hypothetical protein